jgi:hypothetical protein
MIKFTYIKKEISRPADLAPKGVKSTEQSLKTTFNDTFTHIWKQL